MLCVPVWNRNRISYLAVPLGYRMWQKKESKLELASAMVRQVMPEFHAQKNVIILCDSWYVKQNLGCDFRSAGASLRDSLAVTFINAE